MSEITQGVLAHCISGVGTIIGSFFPKPSEDLGLPPLHRPPDKLLDGWKVDGAAIRGYWLQIGSDIRHAMIEISQENSPRA